VVSFQWQWWQRYPTALTRSRAAASQASEPVDGSARAVCARTGAVFQWAGASAHPDNATLARSPRPPQHLTWQLLYNHIRSLCAVDGLLKNPMSSNDLDLCTFAAPLCSEPYCVLDALLYLFLKARQGHSLPPDCARLVAALCALLSANHFPMMVDCAKASGWLSCPQRPC
jgi:hypothetical protein